MERLTKYSNETTHENGVCCTHFGGPECCEVGGNCALDCKWEETAWERLARYEDAGLAPAEVLSMHSEWNAMMSVLNSIGSYSRLRELAEAEKDGRVVVLPCKVGDTVYFALLGRIIEKQVFSIVSFSNSTRIYCGGTSEYFRPEDMGKTFFLAREEAEKALQEMGGKKDGNETSM